MAGHGATGKAAGRAETLEEAVLRHAREHPQQGQARAAAALTEAGIAVSPAGVRYIWLKHGLETAYKRLRAIGAGAADTARPLTPGQRGILQRGEAARRLARQTRRAGARGGDWPEERRSHILLAAAELFVRHGYAGTSMRDIAQRVGLLPGSVYHYFPAKEDLFVAVNHEGFRKLIAQLDEAIRVGRSARDRLERACAAHIEAVVGDDPIGRITATALFAIHENKLQRRMRGDRRAYDDRLRDIVAGLDVAGRVDPSLFRLALLGALNWTRVWYRGGGKSPAAIAREFVSIFLGEAAP